MRIIGVDTETVRGEPWSVQIFTPQSVEGEMYYCDDIDEMGTVRMELEGVYDTNINQTLTVLHNAKFDLRVLSQLDIHPSHCECTMQMAYLLGEPALSLKVLAYRIAGIDMRTYEEVVFPATQAKMEKYLSEILDTDWPDPDPVMKTAKDGSLKFVFPTNIRKKASNLFKKYQLDSSLDIRKKWSKMEENRGRGQVEAVMGKPEIGYLDEIDPQIAEEYAKLDAEATFAIYPYLHAEIERLGLQGSLERDMDCMPMIIEMEDNGVLVDKNELLSLKHDLNELTEGVQADINYLAGRYVNPRSSQQVVALLQDEGIYTDIETSTDASVLDQYREHVIVNKIQDYRAYTKLQSTYVEGLMKLIQPNGRIHTTYSTTRTETGRLASSKPNLQNIPVRTELGRRIRKAFIAERGMK